MLRWSDDQLREYHSKRQGRAEAHAEARQHQKEVKRPKYNNRKTSIDGRTFDSKLEAARYVELKRLQEGGIISGLQCQVPFALEINGNLICKYVCDFRYVDIDGRTVTEDAKGMRTREYTLKKKLMKAIHGIEIREFRKEKPNARSPR